MDKTSQPLAYYIKPNPEEAEDFILTELQETYGLYLEHLNKVEKLHLITMIASNLCFQNSIKLSYRKEIYQLMSRITGELLVEEQEALLEALIDGVRYQEPKKNDDVGEEQIKPLSEEELDAYENSVSCWDCHGTGRVYILDSPTKCTECKGTGYI
ncbi:hypothetical protein [Nostoc sp.]|uniref:hypothetical protein n=1 Tax=Nostoc sp. TaxID=1180 RepID=UPI002FF6AE1F